MGGYFLEGMSWKTVLNSFNRAVGHDNTNISRTHTAVSHTNDVEALRVSGPLIHSDCIGSLQCRRRECIRRQRRTTRTHPL